MRILLIADIHANWPALQAVAAEPHDLCLCLGDLVDYCLDPVPCVDWVRRNVQVTVRGNHDHGVAQNVSVIGKNGFKFLTGVTRILTRQLLSQEDVRYLGRLPITRTLSIENTRFLMAHASPRDPLDEYAPPDPDFWTRRLQNIDADVICIGHTHHPYVLEAGGKLVINPGSVGQPRDGDPRASYAVIQDYNVELKRIEYPIEETIAVIQSSALSDAVKEALAEVVRSGQSILNNGQKPGIRGQESGIRDQESGVRQQESGSRSQGSGVRSQGSGVSEEATPGS
jgi:putative phosphoesterase